MDAVCGGLTARPVVGEDRPRDDADKATLYIEGPAADERTPSVGVTVTDARSEARVPVAAARSDRGRAAAMVNSP